MKISLLPMNATGYVGAERRPSGSWVRAYAASSALAPIPAARPVGVMTPCRAAERGASAPTQLRFSPLPERASFDAEGQLGATCCDRHPLRLGVPRGNELESNCYIKNT